MADPQTPPTDQAPQSTLPRPSSDAGTGGRRDGELLSAFLAGRDVPCPRCDYNLRDLVGEICPECRTQLELSVGRRHTPHALFILAIIPGSFCGVLLGALFTALTIHGELEWPPPPLLALLSGWAVSAAVAVILVRSRARFVEWSMRKQAVVAGTVWGLHVAVFLTLVLIVS